MSSGGTSQRMEFLITKSGSRITHIHIHIRVIASVIDVVQSVPPEASLKAMLLYFYNDLVQDCNSWQTSMSYFRHVTITTGKIECSTHGAVQLRRISKIFNRSMHDRCRLWVRQCNSMSPMSFIINFLIQSFSVKGVSLHRMKFRTNPSLRAVSVGSRERYPSH